MLSLLFSLNDTVDARIGSTRSHNWQVFGQISAADPISPKLNPDLHNLFAFLAFDSIKLLRKKQVLVFGPDGCSLNTNSALGLSLQVGSGLHDWQVFGQISAADPIFPISNPDVHNLFAFFLSDLSNLLRKKQVLVFGPDGCILNANSALGFSSQATVGDNDGKSVVGHLTPHVNLHTSAAFLNSPNSVCLRQIFF